MHGTKSPSSLLCMYRSAQSKQDYLCFSVSSSHGEDVGQGGDGCGECQILRWISARDWFRISVCYQPHWSASAPDACKRSAYQLGVLQIGSDSSDELFDKALLLALAE